MNTATQAEDTGAAEADTFVALLRQRARSQAEQTAYIFLRDGETEAHRMSYAELDRQARRVARTLRALAQPGDRALLVFPHGADYLSAFFGCLYAGVVPVPAYPPSAVRPERAWRRLRAIVASARPALVLGCDEATAALQPLAAGDAAWSGLHFLSTSQWSVAHDFEPRGIEAGQLAMLQYTSGSTADPKGVMVTHANLMANSAQIREGFGHGPWTVFVSWLPLYHDMGLIGGMLQPLYLGIPCVLMAPADFLQRPMRWLEAISRYRATTSGGPNFAYELCLQRATPAQIATLDLACWTVAFNGSEPVRADTLDRFARSFAPCGFAARALYPCYGLAEATLFVSGPPAQAHALRLRCDPSLLERHRAVESTQADACELVSCGQAWSQQVSIADLTTGEALEERRVGEIVVSGDSVTAGYWGLEDDAGDTFVRDPAGRATTVLRTGDLGFKAAGQLFVTGRLKDLIIVRGRNLYPQDLEHTAGFAHPAIQAGSVAAFSVAGGGGEQVVVVAEVGRHHLRGELAPVSAALRQAIAREHDASVARIVLLRPGSLPKTSSGKVQRGACREALLQGRLNAVLDHSLPSDGPQEWPVQPQDRAVLDPAGALPTAPQQALVALLAAMLQVPGAALDPHAALADHGLDSLGLLEFQARVEQQFGVTLPLRRLFDGASLAELAGELPGMAAPRPVQATVAAVAPRTGFALSPAQHALWLDTLQAPRSDACHVAAAFKVLGPLEEQHLCDAVRLLNARHELLRITLHEVAGEPLQQVRAQGRALAVVDAAGWPAERLQDWLHDTARQPFDLSQGSGPLARFHLLRRGPGEHVLLLVAHHLVADLAAAARLLSELQALLAAAAQGHAPALAPVAESWLQTASATCTAARQERVERAWHHWQSCLAGTLPRFDPPTDKPRVAPRSRRGGRHRFELGTERSTRVGELARRLGVTPHVLLLSVYQVLLHRWSGQPDLLVGMPSADSASLLPGAALGYRVTPVLLRSTCEPETGFDSLARQTGQQLTAALAHRELALAALAERLGVVHDATRPALVQAWFSLQRAPTGTDPRLAALLLGIGRGFTVDGLLWEPLHLPRRDVAGELSLVLADSPDGLCGLWEYAADLFDERSVRWLAERWLVLLDGVLAAPSQAVDELPLVGAAERAALLSLGRGAPATPWQGGLAEAFLRSAARLPALPAVQDGERSLDHGALAAAARETAGGLRAAGVQAGDRVALCLRQPVDLVTGLIATQLLAAIYLPLDPAYPAERLRHMLADAAPRVLVVDGFTDASAPLRDIASALGITCMTATALAGATTAPVEGFVAVAPDAVAYLLYTSGSTGSPKGALCTHGAVLNLLADFDARQPLRPGDRCSWWTSASFDVSIYEIFSALLYGGTLCPVPAAARLDGTKLAHWMAEERIASAYLPPFLLSEWREAAQSGQPAALRRLLVGVEPIPERLLCDIRRALPGGVVLNGYGPTETTICATVHELGEQPLHDLAPIGRPLRGTELLVLDERGRLAPWGVPGELHIGGVGLAAGYWQRPALTAAGFVPHPLGVEGAGHHAGFAGRARVYRSGDRVRWLPEGVLAFLGRDDQQVKLRGHRIELGEVEAALRLGTGVRDAVVVLHDDGAGPQLAAYVVMDETATSLARVRSELRQRLPAHMLPASCQVLERLPQTPGGKLDRRSLPAPTRGGDSDRLPSPEGPVATVLAQIWAGLLNLDHGPGDGDFFALGGHSLLAVRAMQMASEAFGLPLSPGALFEHSTLGRLTRHVEERLQGHGDAVPPVHKLARGQPLPLSPQQQRLWLLQQLEPTGTAYSVVWAADLNGRLDRTALQASLAALVERHEAFRTHFEAIGGVPQQNIAAALPFQLALEAVPPELLEGRLATLAREPFDLGRAPLLRAHLLQVAADHAVLFMATHHIVFDGVHETFMHELAALYRAHACGVEPDLQRLHLQPADLAGWQREQLGGAAQARLTAHWLDALAGELPVLSLPTDKPRPALPSGHGARHRFTWPGSLAQQLRQFTRSSGSTAFATVLAAFQALLWRWSGQPSFQVGSPVVDSGSAGACCQIGCFVNTVVLRAELAGNPSFAELVAATRARVLAALAHQALPFDTLVEALKLPRDASRHALVQTFFVLQPDPWASAQWSGPDQAVTVTPREIDGGGARFDLLLSVWQGEQQLGGCIEYATDLFLPTTMARFGEQLAVLLQAVLAAPHTRLLDLPLLAPAQRELQLQGWNDTAAASAEAELLHHAFERQAALRPQALAVIDPARPLRYGELDAAANRLAHALRQAGAEPGSSVAVLMPRKVSLVVALLGVLKAGAAYVPVEPGWPVARTARVLATLGIRHLVTVGGWLDRASALQRAAASLSHVVSLEDTADDTGAAALAACCGLTTARELARMPPTRPPLAVRPGDLAYTIFTSGSTGVPKGVMVQHAAAVNLCGWVNRSFGVGPTDRLLFVTSVCFDLSVYDVFGALGAGAAVRVASDDEVHDPERLHRILVDEGITFWDSAPATLQQLQPLFRPVSGDTVRPALRLVFLSGDWIPVRLPDSVRSAFPDADVVALGGATEAAIWSNFHRVGRVAPGWASIPYGRPIANARYYVLDARLQPRPVGLAGDLYIGGECLALGYAAAPALTAASFVPDPFSRRPGARMYRTGDLCRFEADGTMIFLGRSDHQVKLRGYRIEIGEIEAVLADHPAVASAAVLCREDQPGDKRLVAYVVAQGAERSIGAEPALTETLRAHLAALLPAYMLPAAFVWLAHWPLNASGKLDRAALPPPETGSSTAERQAPRTALERSLHATWVSVLGHDSFGVDDNFFELGGHSLSAFELVSRLREIHAIELPLRALFEAPTVAALGLVVERAGPQLVPAPAQLPAGAATDEPVLDLAALLLDIERLPA